MNFYALFNREIRKNFKMIRQGLEDFEKEGRTDPAAYLAMRRLFVLTNGRSNDEISKRLSARHEKYNDVTAKGILGDLDTNAVKKISESIRENGFYIFDQKLSSEMVSAILRFARNEPVKYLKVDNGKGDITYSKEYIRYDVAHPISPRYQFDQVQSLKSSELQELIFDQSLLAVAQEYLMCPPILDLIALWWSLPYEGKGMAEAAQMYHFDLDRIKFMKFFFYLTDVKPDTGPHCYVKGSSHRLPLSLRKDGRMTDEEVEKAFGKERMLELCGEKGTIMAVDTRGLHKGKSLTGGERLIFQIEFTNSMFGQNYPPIDASLINPVHREVFQKYPYTYNQLMK